MQSGGLNPVSRLCVSICAVAGLLIGSGVSAQPRLAVAAEDPLTCPDTQHFEARTASQHSPDAIRQLAPSAATQPSSDLFSHARMAGYAYDLYGVFIAGQDPAKAFQYPDLKLVGMIYGDPGRDTERRTLRKSTATFYGFVADEVSTGRRYIVFRGTQAPAEWVRNMQAGQRPYPAGTPANTATARVHAGFYQIYQSLTFTSEAGSQPFDAALSALSANRNVLFVGHSLGSALATFAGVGASQLSPASANRFRIVTVASPRVGDAGFAKLARQVGRIDRICNLPDIVPAVPPSVGGLSYVHVGIPYRVSAFDQPRLVNDLKKDGDQIGCWHSDQSYDVMLNPDYVPPKASVCVVKPR